jgi:hypothetical protein
MKAIKQIVIILIIGLSTTNTQASSEYISGSMIARECTPTSDQCNFYDCAEEYLQCGEKGYLQTTAKELCNPQEYENIKSEKILNFSNSVRRCLQEEIIEIADQTNKCQKIKQLALESHVPCFIESGFCSLTLKERMKIFKNPLKKYTVTFRGCV